MARDELQFRIRQAGMPSQIRDGLVAERVCRCLHAGLLRVCRHDLLHTAGAVLGVSPGLKSQRLAEWVAM